MPCFSRIVLISTFTFICFSEYATSSGTWRQLLHPARRESESLPETPPVTLPGSYSDSSWGVKSPLLGPYEDPTPQRETEAYFTTENNTAVAVQAGGTAALRCQVYQVGEEEVVSWVRHNEGHHLITVGVSVYSTDHRFKVSHHNLNQDWTLHLRPARANDSGTYECQLSTHPPMSIMTHLTVVEVEARITGSPEVYLQAGSSLNLHCVIHEYIEPPVFVFWFHNDRMINYDGDSKRTICYDGKGASELGFRSTSPSDSGNYTCVPSNAKPASVIIHVLTQELPAAMQSNSSLISTPGHIVALLSLALFLVAIGSTIVYTLIR